jgi:hypothetical protein
MLPLPSGPQGHCTVRRKHKVIELITAPAKPVVLHGRLFVLSSYHTHHPTITQVAQFPVAGRIEAMFDHVAPGRYMDVCGLVSAAEVNLSNADY